MSVLNKSVLVLNQNYDPLHVCNVRRAVVLVERGKAEVIDRLDRAKARLRTVSGEREVPSVIRMVYFIRRPRPVMRLSRREVFVPGSVSLSVLRSTGGAEGVDAGSRSAAFPRGRAYLGESGDGVPAV